MQRVGIVRLIIGVIAGGCALALLPGAAPAQTVSTLFNFAAAGGIEPYGRMILDSSGNLYGTTSTGGKPTTANPYPAGTVFELKPVAGKTAWAETVHYTFKGGADGSEPTGALHADSKGNLYGTTFLGGADGDGTVFELKKGTGKNWRKIILYNFTGNDGDQPFAGLVADQAGDLFGVTTAGGQNGQGVVFELKAKTFAESVLYSFVGPEGSAPNGGLVIDSAGNLFGTASTSSLSPYAGSVFELSPPPAGQSFWTFTQLHAFTGGADGGSPQGAMVEDGSGNLYGATFGGTGMGDGTLFELSPSPGSFTGYSYQVIFTFNGAAGSNPFGDLALDSSGNLWGSLLNSSDVNSSGGLFVVSPPVGGTGSWTQSISYLFNGSSGGFSPYAGLALDGKGNAYGANFSGGKSGVGTAFKFTP
jgi:uncharacterized repeat protein (TIGR03803 family)